MPKAAGPELVPPKHFYRSVNFLGWFLYCCLTALPSSVLQLGGKIRCFTIQKKCSIGHERANVKHYSLADLFPILKREYFCQETQAEQCCQSSVAEVCCVWRYCNTPNFFSWCSEPCALPDTRTMPAAIQGLRLDTWFKYCTFNLLLTWFVLIRHWEKWST